MNLEHAVESGLHHLLDNASQELLRTWKTLCEKSLGYSIPVAVASRYDSDNPAVSGVVGKMNSGTLWGDICNCIG